MIKELEVMSMIEVGLNVGDRIVVADSGPLSLDIHLPSLHAFLLNERQKWLWANVYFAERMQTKPSK